MTSSNIPAGISLHNILFHLTYKPPSASLVKCETFNLGFGSLFTVPQNHFSFASVIGKGGHTETVFESTVPVPLIHVHYLRSSLHLDTKTPWRL